MLYTLSLSSTILYYAIPYHTILYYTISYYTILYYTILYYTILYYTILYYTILYYTILYYTTLHYTILYYIILYYTILFLGQRVVPCLLEVKQFYHPRSEDSLQSTHTINQGGFFGSLVAVFSFISRDYY